jgi:translin
MTAGDRAEQLAALAVPVREALGGANAAREAGLAAARRTIRTSSSSIRAVHRADPGRAASLADEAEATLRQAQDTLAPYPAVAHAVLHDAEKEYAEARLTAALVDGSPLPGHGALGVQVPSWLNGLAEAASELRRHLLDRLREGHLARAEELMDTMEEVYDALFAVDFPDALTGGLRRSVDALRAVLERTRGDVTTAVLQVRFQTALDHRLEAGDGGEDR